MKVKIIFGMFALMILMLAAFAVVPVAAYGQGQTFINLVSKDANNNWQTVAGASGKVMYKYTPKPVISFEGKGFVPGQKYALISYSEPYGTKSNVLGTGTANLYGNIEISGKSLDFVCNPYPTPTSNEYSGTGSKLWVVPVSDFDVGTGLFTAWNPAKYVFETSLANVDCKLLFLNLDKKNPSTWTILSTDGKLTYKADSSAFVFDASNLVAETEYALISYSEPWGTESGVLGTGTADGSGNIQITGSSMPLVCNPYPTPSSDEYSGTGSKIWLVPVSDFVVSTGMFTAWNPANYLFETDLINEGCDLPSVELAKKDGSWNAISKDGKLVFKADDTAFVFKANSLVAGTPYSLISYTESWGSPNGILGSGTADGTGNIQILGSSMPLICNAYTSGEYAGQKGAKIWLVPSSDLTGSGAMGAWNPANYLFETSLIPMTTC
jgi:hypothetical protein